MSWKQFGFREVLDTRESLFAIQVLIQTTKRHLKVDDQLTETISIDRGVKQGCILSLVLFNVYSGLIFEQALGEPQESIVVNCVCGSKPLQPDYFE